MIDPAIVEDIKNRADMIDVVGNYVQLKRAGQRYMGLCPFHKEKSPSFSVDPDRGMFYCFGCHKGGDLITFIREHESMEFEDAVRLLARFAGVQVPEYDPKTAGPGGGDAARAASNLKYQLYEVHEKLAAWYQKCLRAEIGREALAYLTDRGIDDDAIVKFNLGYAPDSFDAVCTWGERLGYPKSLLVTAGVLTKKTPEDPDDRAYDRWRGRIMFPIWNDSGRVIGFSGRVLSKDQFGGKYVNSPETPIFHKSDVLYGLPLARSSFRERGAALICEGQMDVIACHRAGQTHAVAPQGTAFTEGQARKLKRYTEHLVFAFDADNAGKAAALKAADVFLPMGLTGKIVLLGEGEDPDSLLMGQGPEALEARVAGAVDYFDFLLETLCTEHDPKHPEGQAQIVEAFLERVAKLESPIARSGYCTMAEERLRLVRGMVAQELQRLTNREHRKEMGRNAGRGGAGSSRGGAGGAGGSSATGSWRPGGGAGGGRSAGAPGDFGAMSTHVADARGGPNLPILPMEEEYFDEPHPEDLERAMAGGLGPRPGAVANAAPPPRTPNSEAEAMLLDIALNHEVYATRLLGELPHDWISDSPVGQALNQVLAVTAQEEWDAATQVLQDKLAEYDDTLVNRIVFAPNFGTDAKPEILDKCFRDCLNTIQLDKLTTEIREMERKMKHATDRDEKRAIQRRHLELVSKRNVCIAAKRSEK